MRQVDAVRERFRRAVAPHYAPAGGQPTVAGLMDTELCLYLLATVASGQAAGGVPALLDGYRSVWDAVTNVPADASVRLANARTLLWRIRRPYGWPAVLAAYRSVPEHVRGYRFDALDRPVRRDCSIAATRFEWFEELLTEPLPFAGPRTQVAAPGSCRMGSTARGHGVTVPDDLPSFPPSGLHDLSVRDRRPIEVSWDELLATARGMDDDDRVSGSSNAWEERLRDVTLQARAVDDTFDNAPVLRVDRMLHMVGLVSVGKSTLVMVLATWAAQHGHTVTIVVGDNSAALRAVHELARYREVRAAPVMGQNRSRHAERLHHLQPPSVGRLLPRSPYGFDLVSTACALGAVRHEAIPLQVREAPCQHLIEVDPDAGIDGWRGRPRKTCPLWHGCQRHEAARRLVDANVWVATPWSLVHTPVPDQLSGARMRYLEAAWRRSDLVLVDEADQVQANLDQMFASAQVLLGPSKEAWIDEVGAQVAEKLRNAGRAPVRSPQIRRFSSALNHARTAADVIYQLLQRDRSRPGRPVLSWLDRDYFTAWTLFDTLAKDWAGYPGSQERRPEPGWDSDGLYERLRHEFDAFIDDPTVASGDVAGGLSLLAGAHRELFDRMTQP